MPRKRKNAPQTLEEEIQQIEAAIAEHKEAIKELTAKLKDAKEAKKKADMEALLDAITASGKTIEDVLAAIQNDVSSPDNVEQ